MALYISNPRQGQKSQLVCTNPNCQHHSHTIKIYYWPGEGKEGQFLPGFRKRSRIRELAANTQQESNKPLLTANIAFISKEND